MLVGPDLTVKLHDFMPRHDGDYYISTGRSDHLQDMAPESIKEGSHTTASEVCVYTCVVCICNVLLLCVPY